MCDCDMVCVYDVNYCVMCEVIGEMDGLFGYDVVIVCMLNVV